jgi:hypothetical protein
LLANSTAISAIAAAAGALLAQRATAEALARLTALVAAMDEARGAATAMESHIVQGKERFLAAAADDLDE